MDSTRTPFLVRFAIEAPGFTAGRSIITRVAVETTDDDPGPPAPRLGSGVLVPMLALHSHSSEAIAAGRTIFTKTTSETSDDPQ
jgi:hypothetical protein